MQRTAASALFVSTSGEPRIQRLNIAWPRRAGDLPLGGYLHVYDEPMRGWTGFRIPRDMAIDGDDASVEMARPLADAVRAELGVEQLFLTFEAERSYIVVPKPAIGSETGDGRRYSVFQSATTMPYTLPAEEHVPEQRGVILEMRRTWFRLTSPGPAEDQGASIRGLAVLMPGMYGTPEAVVDRAERSLLASDWVVLRMLAPPARMTERYEAMIDIDGDRTTPVATLALVLDDRAAECAYAVRAGVADAMGQYPILNGLPRVIIGMSGTGITLPTVVAREPGAYSAAAIIAGGANSFRISRDSSYRDWIDSVEVRFDGRRPTPDEIRELDDLYLSLSRLDSYHTAPLMQSMPVLIVHGTADRAVPAETGELLWQRLGEPERWEMPVGHELVFASMMLRIGGVVEWLNDRSLGEPPAFDPSVVAPGRAEPTP